MLEPTYNKLAKHLRGIESLVIAKMDGATNEQPRAQVHFTSCVARFCMPVYRQLRLILVFFSLVRFRIEQ